MSADTGAQVLGRARRITVKIGSSLLLPEHNRLDAAWLDSLVTDIAMLAKGGHEIVVVTSGAIAFGRGVLGLRGGAGRLEEKQAAAAVGQIGLAQAWQASLARQGLQAAQILLTLDDTENRRRYLNGRATLESLIRMRVVPVVNENDTVATTEIRFGDNDRLSARVAVMTSCNVLVLLSDIDGLYTGDPRRDLEARHVPVVGAITPEIQAMAGGSGSAVGTGGMITKLAAAEIATGAGCAVLLASGRGHHPLRRLQDGERCTLFKARATPRRARKDWLAGRLDAMGTLVLDEGAVRALLRGGSLLPAGVRHVEGSFGKGDAVLLQTPDGRVIAKGLCTYDAADAVLIAGCRTEDIEARLGYRGRNELVHRDDMVLL